MIGGQLQNEIEHVVEVRLIGLFFHVALLRRHVSSDPALRKGRGLHWELESHSVLAMAPFDEEGLQRALEHRKAQQMEHDVG